MKLKEILGACMYNYYGCGGHQSPGLPPYSVQGLDVVTTSGKWITTIRALPKFKLHRAFVDNWIVVPETASNNQTFTLKCNPTEQNFFFDDFFKLQKANGISNIWSASGCFDWYKPALGSHSQRKTACYDPAKSPTDGTAWKDLATLCALIATRYKDNLLVDYIQVLNEWDFRWNVPHVLTPEEYAVGFYECYKAIRSVSASQKIMTGCTLTPKLETAQRLFAALDKLTEAEGHPKIRDVVFTFNLYIRNKSTNQGDGIGATPEEVDIYGTLFKPLNDWCKAEGLKFACTESGYNSSPSTSASAMKNKAPMLEGYTLEEAQGILAIRTALIIGSCSECVGITFYHCKDGYEAEPFTYHGFNYDKDFGGKPDWSAKPARTICEEFLEKYGEWSAEGFNTSNGSFFSIFLRSASGDLKHLAWTDKKHYSGLYPVTLTAMPMEVGDYPIPPTEPPTNPTMRKVFLTTERIATYEPANEIHTGNSFPTGSYALYVDGEGPVTLAVLKSDGNPLIPSRTENGKPLAFGGDDGGKLRLFSFPSGTYTVKVSGQPDINFTVGTVTPPPTEVKGTGFVKKNGKIEFAFEDGSKLTVTPV